MMCCIPITMNSARTSSFTPTMTLFARALSRAPSSRSAVMSATMPNAGTFTRIGIPPMCGADASSPWMAGSWLSSAVRYPVVSHAGSSTHPARSDLK